MKTSPPPEKDIPVWDKERSQILRVAKFSSDDQIRFIQGIDNTFFDLLTSLYKPFLSPSYRNADLQYTIFSKKYNYPIGFIALNNTKSGGRFLEIALIPSLRGKSYGTAIINKFIGQHPFDKIGWTADKANLPSIKLLKKLNGGFFEKTVQDKKRIEAEGFFRPGGEVPLDMKRSLNELIPESTKKFQGWLKEFSSRKDLLKKLNKYLQGYVLKHSENNIQGPPDLQSWISGLEGIYLVEPHGQLIWDGSKTLIVKSVNFLSMTNKPLALISDHLCFGAIVLHNPTAIASKDAFDALFPRHQISDKDRASWWDNNWPLFGYPFVWFVRLPKPLSVSIPQGIQTFINAGHIQLG